MVRNNGMGTNFYFDSFGGIKKKITSYVEYNLKCLSNKNFDKLFLNKSARSF